MSGTSSSTDIAGNDSAVMKAKRSNSSFSLGPKSKSFLSPLFKRKSRNIDDGRMTQISESASGEGFHFVNRSNSDEELVSLRKESDALKQQISALESGTMQLKTELEALKSVQVSSGDGLKEKLLELESQLGDKQKQCDHFRELYEAEKQRYINLQQEFINLGEDLRNSHIHMPITKHSQHDNSEKEISKPSRSVALWTILLGAIITKELGEALLLKVRK